MKENLGHLRKSYQKSSLELSDVGTSPLELFQKWFEMAKMDPAVEEVNAMSLATLGTDGFPKSRIVLLKSFSAEGFVFFTNYDSEKGLAIAQHPQVGLTFFWPSLERQVIIKGRASKIATEESDTYFQSRPKGSQLGALVSKQSQEIPNRAVLDEALKRLEKQYEALPISRPQNWGGYMIAPRSIEFWQGRPNRLHDRILARWDGEQWNSVRLSS
jgi:pyridoxamine 5'-phosphate oxidase